jgi:hypothetical protein
MKTLHQEGKCRLSRMKTQKNKDEPNVAAWSYRMKQNTQNKRTQKYICVQLDTVKPQFNSCTRSNTVNTVKPQFNSCTRSNTVNQYTMQWCMYVYNKSTAQVNKTQQCQDQQSKCNQTGIQGKPDNNESWSKNLVQFEGKKGRLQDARPEVYTNVASNQNIEIQWPQQVDMPDSHLQTSSGNISKCN